MTRSTPRDYVRLLGKLALFAILPAIAGALPIWMFGRLGEIRCIDAASVARDQIKGEELLYGPAYSDCTSNLKMGGVLAAKADVIVLGTSRSVQLRGAFFKSSFYNAGGSAPRAGDLRGFLAKVPREAQPKVVLLVLDQFFVNDATDRQSATEFRPLDEALAGCTTESSFLAENWTRPYRDLLAGKIPMSAIFSADHPDRLGVRARVQGSGYRRDGSFRIAGPESFDEVRDRMAKGVRRYEPGDEPSPVLVDAIVDFLADARTRGIDVIGIHPSWAPTIYDEIHALGKWPYLDKVHPALVPRFEAFGDAIFDYSDPRPVGLGDREFYDGHHPSERAWGVILLDLAQKDRRIADIIDGGAIRRMLASSTNALSIVPDQF